MADAIRGHHRFREEHMNDRPNNTAFENVETPLGPVRVGLYYSTDVEPKQGRLHAVVTAETLTVNRIPVQVREEFVARTDLDTDPTQPGLDSPEAWTGIYTGGIGISRSDRPFSRGNDVSDAAKGKVRTACREAIAKLFAEHIGLVYAVIADSLAVSLYYLNNKVAEKRAELAELETVLTNNTERLEQMRLMMEPSPLDLADDAAHTDEMNKLFGLGIYANER
jgi:hypothetical protein